MLKSMRFYTSMLLLFGIVASSGSVEAQVPDASTATAEALPPNKPDDAIQVPPEPTKPKATTLKNEAAEWVKSNGWKPGRNKKDGSFIAIGVGSYDGDSGRMALNRTLAFQSALFAAKNKMAKYLSSDIQVAAAAFVSQGTLPRAEDGLPLDVVQQVAGEAKKDGLSGDTVEKGTSRQFARAVQVLARAQVAGSSIVKVIDNGKPGSDGAIAVVVRWSPKTKALAETAVGKKPGAVQSDTAPSVAEIDNLTEDDLHTCFGARVMRNDENEACIVAFGQGEAKDTGEAEMEIAEEIAQTDSSGNIRQFVGEMILCNQLLNQASSYSALANGGKPFESSQGFSRECESRAAALNMAGIEEVRAWEGQRKGARPVAGVVQLWSVSGSTDATRLRNEFNELNAAAGGAGRSNIPTGVNSQGKPSTPTPGRDLPSITPGPSQSPNFKGKAE